MIKMITKCVTNLKIGEDVTIDWLVTHTKPYALLYNFTTTSIVSTSSLGGVGRHDRLKICSRKGASVQVR